MGNRGETSSRRYDLEDRTLQFGKDVIRFCTTLQKNMINRRLIDQIIRSATSIGANYIEANDALGKKDFVHRLRISRKETKETIYWINLLKDTNNEETKELNALESEAIEIRNILSAIINKVV